MKNYIYILLIHLLLTACNTDKFLDVKPTGVIIPETVDDYDNLLENPVIGGTAGTMCGTAVIWNNLRYMDPDAYITETIYNEIRFESQLHYQWEGNHDNENFRDTDWTGRYKMIYTYNTVIANIDNAPLGKGKTEADRRRVKGEAYAQRAFDLFMLVNEYAPQYSVENREKAGIPMPLVADIDARLSKSTVGEVYDQILSDLAVAEPLLADKTEYVLKYNFRPGIAAIKALYARVYLHTGNFAEAVKFSNEALADYDFVYDFTAINHNTAGNPWDGIDLPDFQFIDTNQSVLWSRVQQFSFYHPGTLYHSGLAALFDQVNDKRFTLFSHTHTFSYWGAGIDVRPYFAYAKDQMEHQAGITVPNLILINAEAKARTGDGIGAIAAINKLLEKRIVGFTPLVHTSDAATLQRVKNERRKELMGTGNNLIDLKRYHAYGEPIPTFTRTIDGQTFILEPGSTKYIVPVSKIVKDLNPNL